MNYLISIVHLGSLSFMRYMYSGLLRGNFVRNTHSLLTWSYDYSSVYVEKGSQVNQKEYAPE